MNILYANDQAGAYPTSYYAATVEPIEDQPVLKGEVRADVCVLGGGYSGLSTALHLRQRGFDVVLVDAHRVGWGASGRNGGQVSGGQRVDQGTLIKDYGRERARDLWQIGNDAKALVKQFVEDYQIDCDLRPGILYPNHKKTYTDETKAAVDLLQQEYGYDQARYVPLEEMRTLIGSTAYYDGEYDAGSAHLHPLAYAFGLAKAALAAGVKIFERSEVVEIDDKDPIVVRTQQGAVTAKYLVLAANGYLGTLHRYTADRVMPINNYIIATEPLSQEMAKSLISNDAAVADSKFVINYFKLSRDNRLLFGGRESYRYQFPADIKSFVKKAMVQIFPQLHETRVDYGWGGVLGITLNRMPHFEWLKPNMITIGGYSGQGVALGTLGGALAGEAIAGVAERFDIMAGVKTHKFPGGHAARQPLLALAMAFYSLRDRL